MYFKFINHASIIIGNENFKFLTDPWYCETVFNDGWRLIYEDESQNLNNIEYDYIWYSHEHPDHFSVKDLKKISKEKKNKFKILFQKTKDKKVSNYLKKNNFIIEEMENLKTYELKKNIFFTINNIGGFDSWSMLEIDGKNILNLNDCNLSDNDLIKIKNKWNKVDILLTQFSFASWICNPGDNLLAKKQVERVYKRVSKQIDILKPKEIIPFASFMYFCHEENKYLNEYTVKIKDFYNYFKDRCKVTVLFPEEVYESNKPHDNNNSLLKWQECYQKRLNQHYLYNKPSIPFQDLNQEHSNYVSKIKKKNNFILIKLLSFFGFFKNQKIFLKDLDIMIKFNLTESLKIYDNTNNPDLTMSSESFYYLLKYNWGRGTLFISGRVKCKYSKLQSFMNITKIFYSNNIDLYLTSFRQLRYFFKKNNFSKLIEEFCE
ncbi:MBL fold metallo-hydrolase [Candidatus Pelagibacter sp.]|nr:MBL fold metallo-hydrolase [Candidatus Pelagibacter sp.]